MEKEYQPKGLAKILDKFFHFKEKGSTMSKEIFGGITIFILSVVVLLINTRIIGEAVSADRVEYCGIYLSASLIAFLGSLAIGLIARLPLVQVTSLGLATSFIALIGGENGLTYENLLAISWISSLLYAILASIPALKKALYKAIPTPIRKALPLAIGAFMVAYGLSDAGILTTSTYGLYTVNSVSSFSDPVLMIGAVSCLVGCIFTICFIFMKDHISKPVLYGFLIGMMVFFVGGLWYGFSLIYSVNRAYLAAGAENMYTLSLGFSGLDFGGVFTKGFDFSSYTGNLGGLWIYGLIAFIVFPFAESTGEVEAVGLYNDSLLVDEFETYDRAIMVNAITNVVAPIFGVLPVSFGKASVAASHDGAKTGLSSVVASLGFLVACFTWALFALLASYTAIVSDYGHTTSNSFAEYAQATFAFVDGIMIALGLSMWKALGSFDYKDLKAAIPAGILVVVMLVSSNIVVALAYAVLAYVVINLLSFNKEKIKEVGLPTYVLACVLLVALFCR